MFHVDNHHMLLSGALPLLHNLDQSRLFLLQWFVYSTERISVKFMFKTQMMFFKEECCPLTIAMTFLLRTRESIELTEPVALMSLPKKHTVASLIFYFNYDN